MSKTEKNQEVAAAKAGMAPNTAREYLRDSRLPSERKEERSWRTRPDAFTEVWDEILNVNLKGTFYACRAAIPHLKPRRGNIVNIGSTASHRGAPNGTAYYASKFALRGMTECWRQELRKNNIRVFMVNPSEVITSFGAAAGFEQKDNPSKLRPEDIAHAAVFLASDESSFVNGHDLVIDGAITGGRNWTQQQQGLAALRKVFDEGGG